jgi:hypothetical protein
MVALMLRIHLLVMLCSSCLSVKFDNTLVLYKVIKIFCLKLCMYRVHVAEGATFSFSFRPEFTSHIQFGQAYCVFGWAL